MLIPSFNLSGVLPPYLGSNPGGNSDLMSPYGVSVFDVLTRFHTSPERGNILIGWLEYRKALRGIGFTRGFQWLDGSFLEDKEGLYGEAPNDLDLVVFLRRPSELSEDTTFREFVDAHRMFFDRKTLKLKYHIDVFPVDLDGNPESVIAYSCYFLQLFSHQRDTGWWKGMLRVSQEDEGEDVLLAKLVTYDGAAMP